MPYPRRTLKKQTSATIDGNFVAKWKTFGKRESPEEEEDVEEV